VKEHFYRAFEGRLRGSRELVKERQAFYLSFVKPLKTLYTNCPALDLGCGRGEWLEILSENGLQARGVDVDPGMLEACYALNLPAEQGEALETLKLLADESLALISGFHIVEHMPFECLQELVAESLRVLKPAGLLILESPNAENLIVGTNNFYLDPSHARPIPHLLLSFLIEHVGFARFKLLRLQEPPELAKAERIALMNVLAGVSPDYAIVAQKWAPAGQMEPFNHAFNKDYGLTLDMLAQRYDGGLQRQFGELKEALQEVVDNTGAALDRLKLPLEETKARLEKSESRGRSIEAALRENIARTIQAEIKQAAVETLNETLRQQVQQAATESNVLREEARQLELQLQQARQQLSEVQHNSHHWYLRANAYEAQAKDVLNSTSWRITKPLRLLMICLRQLKGVPSQKIRRLLRSVLSRAMRWVMGRPLLRQRLVDRLKRHQTLFQHLRLFALNHGLLGAQMPPAHASIFSSSGGKIEDLVSMTPRARQIFIRIEQSRQKNGAH